MKAQRGSPSSTILESSRAEKTVLVGALSCSKGGKPYAMGDYFQIPSSSSSAPSGGSGALATKTEKEKGERGGSF